MDEREDPLTAATTWYNGLAEVKKSFFDKAGFCFSDLEWNAESREYGACSFRIDGKMVQYRMSKITPKKVGQFVAIWKRDTDGTTAPFDVSDDLDFLIIFAKREGDFGQFVFSKTVLIHKGLMSANGKIGKRGMRIYPPWDLPTSPQALKAQAWQTRFFVKVETDGSADLSRMKKLMTGA